MSNTLTDSQKLSMLANWLGAHSLLSDGKERKFCSDMAADLRRIASDLEKREAPSDEEIEEVFLYEIAPKKLTRFQTWKKGCEWMRYKLTGK